MSRYLPNIMALGVMISDKKIFPCFSLYVKHVTPGVGPFLAPGT